MLRHRLGVQLNQTMIELRTCDLASVEVARCSLRLATSMRLGHAGSATLLGHALAAIALRCRHRRARSCTGHHRHCRQYQRQDADRDFGQAFHAHKSNPESHPEAIELLFPITWMSPLSISSHQTGIPARAGKCSETIAVDVKPLARACTGATVGAPIPIRKYSATGTSQRPCGKGGSAPIFLAPHCLPFELRRIVAPPVGALLAFNRKGNRDFKRCCHGLGEAYTDTNSLCYNLITEQGQML
jgi:hypothetical protein